MRQGKKYELDGNENWYAEEVRREKRLERWGSESLTRNAQMHHEHCDAEALAREHADHCAAEAAREFHQEQHDADRSYRIPSYDSLHSHPQGRKTRNEGSSAFAIIIFIIVVILNLLF